MNNLSILADVVSPMDGSGLAELEGGISILFELFSDLFSIAGIVVVTIGTWKILEKVGEKGWKALIPFYNSYTLFKIFWQKKWFWFSFVSTIISAISGFVIVASLLFLLISGFIGAGVVGAGAGLSLVSGNLEIIRAWEESISDLSSMDSVVGGSLITILIALSVLAICAIFNFVLKIILNIKITKAFGKSGGFAVGLILLAPIFYMILGLGKDKYIKETK